MSELLRRLFGRKPAPKPVCPYCGERTRKSCQDEWLAKSVLPACSCGPRDDASEAEKQRFHAWLDTQSPIDALRSREEGIND